MPREYCGVNKTFEKVIFNILTIYAWTGNWGVKIVSLTVLT